MYGAITSAADEDDSVDDSLANSFAVPCRSRLPTTESAEALLFPQPPREDATHPVLSRACTPDVTSRAPSVVATPRDQGPRPLSQPPQMPRRHAHQSRNLRGEAVDAPQVLGAPRTAPRDAAGHRAAKLGMCLTRLPRSVASLERWLGSPQARAEHLETAMELLFCLQTLDGALQALLSQLDSAKVSNRCGQLLRLADKEQAVAGAQQEQRRTAELTLLLHNLLASTASTASAALRLLRPPLSCSARMLSKKPSGRRVVVIGVLTHIL